MRTDHHAWTTLLLCAAFVCGSAGRAASEDAKSKKTAKIAFKNTSESPAIVKIAGNTRDASYLKLGEQRTFKVEPGVYHALVRLGKEKPYRYFRSKPLDVKESATASLPQTPLEQWNRISNSTFLDSAPSCLLVRGMIVDSEQTPVQWAWVRLDPYKNGKASFKIGDGGVFLNPNCTVEKKDGGRFSLLLNTESFPDHEDFVLQARVDPLTTTSVPLRDGQGALVVLHTSKAQEQARASKTASGDVDLGQIRAQ